MGIKRFLVGLIVLFLAGTGCERGPVGEGIDVRAHALIEKLGPLCEHFDYQTKQEVGSGEIRPMQCSRVGAKDHPEFILFVFSDEETRDAWLEKPLEGTGSVSGDDWFAVSDLPLLDEVGDRLGDE